MMNKRRWESYHKRKRWYLLKFRIYNIMLYSFWSIFLGFVSFGFWQIKHDNAFQHVRSRVHYGPRDAIWIDVFFNVMLAAFAGFFFILTTLVALSFIFIPEERTWQQYRMKKRIVRRSKIKK